MDTTDLEAPLRSLQIGTTADPDADYLATYDYESTTGRMKAVTGPGLPGSTGQNHGAWYAYAANSDLVGQTQFKDESATVIASASRAYEDYRDLVTTLENKWGDTYVISKYEYAYDALGRPKHVSNSGEAFDAYSQDAHSVYGYNNRSELTASDRYQGVYADPPGPAVSDETFAYSYDNIGNREQYTVATPETTGLLRQRAQPVHLDGLRRPRVRCAAIAGVRRRP